MIVAEIQTTYGFGLHHVSGILNKGQRFGETWAIMFKEGMVLVVEARDEQEAINVLSNSKRWSHIIHTSDSSKNNDLFPCDTSDIITIVKCKVHYFVNEKRFVKTGRLN